MPVPSPFRNPPPFCRAKTMNNLLLSSLSVIVACVWVSSIQAATAVASNSTSTRFNFLHAYTTDTIASVLSILHAKHSTDKDFKPQLILITSPGPLPAMNVSANETNLTQGYTLAGGNRIGFVSSQWQVDSEVLLNDSIATRLKSSAAPTLDVCAVTVSTAPMDSLVLSELAGRIDELCVSWGIVLVGFGSPLLADFAQYLEGKTAINGKYAPRAMKEIVAFTQQASNTTQLEAATSANRLFVAFSLAACVENPISTVMAAEQLTTEGVSFCVGPNCTTCGQPPMARDSASIKPHEPSDRRAVIVLLSCGTFLIGCAFVFYVFFRRQFFVPSESTKPEKELTTNLAYVLRM